MAAIRYRLKDLKAHRVIYVVDARQKSHFANRFSVAHHAGYVAPEVRTEHVGFGVVLGGNGKPRKTCSGGNVKLSELFSEATRRACDVVAHKNPEMDERERRAIAKTVGFGAVKYFDLVKNRCAGYSSEWVIILYLDGNTGPYLQYAYSRTRSVLRRAGEWNNASPFRLSERWER
ncbi:arginine--tRNA ligase [Paraburkholderia sp. PGU19]|uniref:arginine--tRNA ligase domain-containing protein n=1 Tax=Paraburkholderia sp. PGU19 TaxID=2735434 RepID=UPI0015DAE782|nr:arginine--tRNA ligase [Paraburkholderia sp. PGU19]